MYPIGEGHRALINLALLSQLTKSTTAAMEDLSKLKVKELKEECRARGLLVSGTKAKLIECLLVEKDGTSSKMIRKKKAPKPPSTPIMNPNPFNFYFKMQDVLASGMASGRISFDTPADEVRARLPELEQFPLLLLILKAPLS
jgi:hypothetical protein